MVSCPGTLSAAVPPARAFHLQSRAYALLEEVGAYTVLLSVLVVRRSERRRGHGTRLLSLLSTATFPGRAWFVPAVVPGKVATAFFAKSGWERECLNQTEMVLRLPSGRPRGPASSSDRG